jgi:Tol biopolymer transport system component
MSSVFGKLKELGERLHAKLLLEDTLADTKSTEDEIAKVFVPELVRILGHRHPNYGDHHLYKTAANDAVLDYLGKPYRFDPSRSDLLGYLSMIGERDLLNAIDKERREAVKRSEVYPAASSGSTEALADEDSPRVRHARALLTKPGDQEFLALMMDNVRSTSEYAKVLGIEDRPETEQAILVKRNKDRIRLRVQRGLKRARWLALLWFLLLRERATAMARRPVPLVVQVIAVAILVATQGYVWLRLEIPTHAKSFASGSPVAGIRPVNGELAIVDGVSGRFEEKIFFASDRPAVGTGKTHIWMINSDATGLEQVTFGKGEDDGPAISPDGLKLAFRRGNRPINDSGPSSQSLWVKDLATGSESCVTASDDWPQGLWVSVQPAWSPDGKRLAFARMRAFEGDEDDRFLSIWMIDVESALSAPRRLTATGTYGYSDPVWAPDGRHILCTKQMAADQQLALYRIDVTTGEEEQVITCVGDEYWAKYSPDGSKVMWTTNRHTHPSDARADIYVADLVDPIGTQRRVSAYSGWACAEWSPDGTRLVVVQPRFKLTDQSLDTLEKLGQPKWLVQRLNSAKHQGFLEGKDLIAEVEAMVGRDFGVRDRARILTTCISTSNLCVANTDGTGFSELTQEESIAFAPCWGIVFQIDVQRVAE